MTNVFGWIAVVDDDPSVLRALSRLLRSREFQAKVYDSAQAFLASLPEGLPQCLIVDQQMPQMTGLELHLHLKRSGIYIPTIMITAHIDPRVRNTSELAGIVAILSKPLQDVALFSAIEAATKAGPRQP